MALAIETVAATGRAALEAAARRWVRLDTDWKSVVGGLAIVGLIVGFDVTPPP